MGGSKQPQPHKPSAGALWALEETLNDLVAAGVGLGAQIPGDNDELIALAKRVRDNARLWHRAPRSIGGLDRDRFQRKLIAAIAAAEGLG